MHVAVVDYGSGNLRSVVQSLRAAAETTGLGRNVSLACDAGDVATADYVVLPGVGAFADCAAGLDRIDGMMAAIEEAVTVRGRPFLGICVGMQLMADRGAENGGAGGFGWIAGEVAPLPAETGCGRELKIPHMGWNGLEFGRSHPVMAGIGTGDAVYFLHSYHYTGAAAEHVVASVEYGDPVVAAIGRDNLLGVQFHPEKSQQVGQALLANWLAWTP